MDCRRFEELLDVFEAGTLPVEQREAAQQHMSACPSCRELHESICGHPDALPHEWHDALTSEILRRTSGPVCNEAELHLCPLMDDDLGDTDREFLHLHVSHCPSCDALAISLRELKETLPEMAALEPGDAFTAEVLQATTRHTTAFAELRKWWRRMMLRPRFAWEAAYVGALLILLAIGNPVPLIQRLPAAFEAPNGLISGGDPILQETSKILDATQAEARSSLGAIRVRGGVLLKETVDFQHRATEALVQKASTYLEQLRADISAAEQAGRPKSESR